MPSRKLASALIAPSRLASALVVPLRLASTLVVPLRRGRALCACVLVAACTPSTPTTVSSARLEPAPTASSGAQSSFRDALSASDWAGAAERIDALPEAEQREPGVRYVRALAAVRLGDCERALPLLSGLDQAAPLLAEDVSALRAECQLALGPYAEAASYFAGQGSSDATLKAAVAWMRAGEPERAKQLAEDVMRANARRGDKSEAYVRARTLRAEVAEQLGDRKLAERDRRWLALAAALPGADAEYERMAKRRLSKRERIERAEQLAERGEVEDVLRELKLAKKAPGAAPSTAETTRLVALAYYRARSDDVKAAELFERAAKLAGRRSDGDRFRAAWAWVRAGRTDRARAHYQSIVKSGSRRAVEQARYSLARLHYMTGAWAAAERGYTDYLRRYARGRGKRRARYAEASRYELAIAQLAAGRSSAAAASFDALAHESDDADVRALLEHLGGLARWSLGNAPEQAEAIERYRRVIERYPLSFAALASAERLRALGADPHLPKASAPWPPNATAALSTTGEIPLPPKARLFANLGLYSAAERSLHAEQRALLRKYQPRAGEVLCQQYASLDRGHRRYALARRIVQHDALRELPTSSTLWAWQCLHPRPYAAAVEALEARYELPSGLVHAVMRRESAFRSDVRSHAGAVGLMQLMPTTAERAARELGLAHHPERLTEPGYNLELGAYYLQRLARHFDANVPVVLASYNAGPHAAVRWLEGGKGLGLDGWVARIPYQETRHYVLRVMASFARYRFLEAGAAAIPRLALDLPPARAPVGLY